MWRPDIRDDTPAGAATRHNLSAVAGIEQRKSNEMIGAELGYRYVDSPVICNIPGGPEHLFREYQPTTWPGARLPHVWLDDGTPLQDRVPDGYTILKLGRTKADLSGLERAIRTHGAPVTVLDVPDRIAREIYGYDLILLRPDLHVVWRGNRAAGRRRRSRGDRDRADFYRCLNEANAPFRQINRSSNWPAT